MTFDKLQYQAIVRQTATHGPGGPKSDQITDSLQKILTGGRGRHVDVLQFRYLSATACCSAICSICDLRSKLQGLEDLARDIIRACFSQERMSYIPAKDALDGH